MVYIKPGFPGGLVVKNLTANARESGLIPGLGRFPGGEHGNPFQYSCLENPMTEDPGRLQSMGLQRVRYDWACRHTCTYPRASVSSIPEPFVLCGANISWQPIAPNSETHSFYWKYIWEFFTDFVYRSAWKQLLFVPISAIPCLSFTLIWVRWINPDMLEIKSNINWLIGPLACASLNTAKNKQTISPLQRSETPWPLKQREDHHKFIIWRFYREIHAYGFI